MRVGPGRARLVRGLVAWVALAALVAACGGDDGQAPTDVGADDDTSEDAGEAWTHLGVAESTLDGHAAAAVVEDADELAAAWSEHGFDGEVPSVGFDDHVVLLLGLPDDACPDELIGLEVDSGELEAEWLPPPGACTQPLILWLQAVQVHRGLLTESFSYGPPAPFEDELERVTLELPAYDGVAPPAPAPPSGMDDAELDEVFAGHAVERCGPEHRVGRGSEVDGPLSDDAEVADAQRRRAEHGLPSDEATTREVMDDPDGMPEYDFPFLPAEQEADQQASHLIEDVMEELEAAGWDLGHGQMIEQPQGHAVPMIDRSDGIRAAVVVGPDDEAAVRELLDETRGGDEVHVIVADRWPPADVAAAQQALTEELLGPAEGAGAIAWISGPPGPVEVGMIDPTREALDAIADVVDPALVCVSPELSGVRPLPG